MMGTARERLTELWHRSGIPQVELDRRAGQGSQWIHNRIAGRANILADDVPILARAFGVPITAFFADAPARRSTTSPALPRLGDEFLARLEADPLHAAEETVVVNIGEAARTVLVRHSRSLLHLIVERDDSAEQDPPA